MPGTDIYGVYVNRDELKAYMSDQKVAGDMPRDDKIISRFCVLASRKLDSWCKRTFIPQLYTNTYDYQFEHDMINAALGSSTGGILSRTIHPSRLRRTRYNRGQELRLHDDLLTLVAITTNNGDTTIDSDDVLLRRGPSRNFIPYDIVEILITSNAQWLYNGTPQAAHTVRGYWGYHPQWPNGAWETIGTHNGVATASATSLTVNGSPDDEVGQLFGAAFKTQQLIKFTTSLDGSTEELAYITEIVDNADSTFTIKVIRGVNGTTAISLTDSMVIQAFRPMYEAQEAVYELAAYTYRRRHAVGKRDDRAIVASQSGMVMLPSTIPDSLKTFVSKYKRTTPKR